MIRPPVVIGSAMLISAAAWSFGPWRMMRVVRNRLVSKELQQAIDSVSGALNALEQKSSPTGSRHPALVNLLILSTLHQRKLVAHTQRRAESPTWKESRAEKKHTITVFNDATRYMRFAACAYGFVVVKGLQILDKSAGWPSFSEFTNSQADKWCILRHTGIDETDLLHVNLSERQRSSFHLPCHFLAVDHATKSVVLAIRGTRSLKDSAVNLMCDNISFCGGQAHRGVAESAMCLFTHMEKDIAAALNRYPGYRLIFTGHSLGGATALLMAFMAKKEKPQLNVEAFAFGPPPSFAPLSNIPSPISQCMHSFINGEDIVPRLSLASCTKEPSFLLVSRTQYPKLMESVTEVDMLDISLRHRIRYLFNEMSPTVNLEEGEAADMPLGLRLSFSYNQKIDRNGGVFSGDSGNIIHAYITDKLTSELQGGVNALVEDDAQLDSHSPIYIPGNIFILSGKNSGDREKVEGMETSTSGTCRRGSPLELTELLLTESAFKHHVLNAYVDWFSGWKDRQ